MTSTLRPLPITLLLLGLMLMPPSAAHAQGSPDVSGFLANPSSLLSRYPLGGASLVGDCRDLILADASTLDPNLNLARRATGDQRNALGTCIGLAALELVRTNPQLANRIQNGVVNLGDQTVLAAYIAVTGNQKLAATQPGGGGSPGGAPAAPAMAAVYPPSQVLPAQSIQDFLANPSALLAQYPDGGPQMIKAVQDLAGSDPRTLNPLISLLSQANPDQSTAIGTALGKIALTALTTDQAYADQIQTAVVRSGNVSAEVAFSAVVGGNIKLTAATTGVGGGAETSTSPSTSGFSVSGPSGPNLHTFATNVPESFTPTFTAGPAGSSPSSPSGPTSPTRP